MKTIYMLQAASVGGIDRVRLERVQASDADAAAAIRAGVASIVDDGDETPSDSDVSAVRKSAGIAVSPLTPADMLSRSGGAAYTIPVRDASGMLVDMDFGTFVTQLFGSGTGFAYVAPNGTASLATPTAPAAFSYPAPLSSLAIDLNSITHLGVYTFVMSANASLSFTNLASNAGKRFELQIVNPSTYTLAVPTGFLPSAFTLSTGNKKDKFSCTVDSAYVTATASQGYAIDNVKPAVSSVLLSADGLILTVNFTEPVKASTWTGFVLSSSGGAVTPTYSSGENTSAVLFSLNRAIQNTETVTRAYSGTGITDLTGNTLDAFSGVAVENTSTVSSASYALTMKATGTKPSGWTDTGSPNWNYTTALDADASFAADGTANYSASPTFTAMPTWSLYGQFMFTDLSGIPYLFKPYNAGAYLFRLRITASGNVRLYSSSGTSLYTATPVSFSVNTLYHVWVDVTAGTGADASVNVYVSTNATKPASPALTYGTGTWTLGLDQIILGNGVAAGRAIVDNIAISATPIGSNPSF